MFKDFSQKSDLLERHTPVCLTQWVPPPPPPGAYSGTENCAGLIFITDRPTSRRVGAPRITSDDPGAITRGGMVRVGIREWVKAPLKNLKNVQGLISKKDCDRGVNTTD